MSEKFRILAIDDDRDILDLLHLTLSPMYEVLTLSDAVDACEVMDFFEPDLVIIDVMMPKVTGYQIIEFIKQSSKHQNVLTVFLSAKDSSRDVKYGYKLGANLYLTKPFQPDRIVKNVGTLLENCAGGRPRKKTFSMRDVFLRLQLKVGLHLPGGATSSQTPATGQPAVDSSTSQFKLRRPLAHEADENERKKWVG